MGYSAYNKRRFQGEKPVEEGQEYDITIEGIGTKGDGIGKIKGFVVIVPNTKEGDTVKIKVNALRGKVAFGEVVGDASASEATEDKPEEDAEAAAADAVEEDETAEAQAEEPAAEASEEAEEASEETVKEPAEGSEDAPADEQPAEDAKPEQAEEPKSEEKKKKKKE